MDYNIAIELDDRINHEPLTALLKLHGLQTSGNKPHLWERIRQAINTQGNSLTIEILDDFIANEICNGKNRTLFLSAFPKANAEQLKDIDHVKHCLSSKGYPCEKFNNLREVSKPQDRALAFLDYSIQENVVEKISLCFVETMDSDEEIEENGSIKQSNNYIWVDILPLEERMIIKMWQRQTFYFDIQTAAARAAYDEIAFLIREMFSLAPRSIQDVKNVLYKMFSELTHTAETPFRTKVEKLSQDIEQFVKNCSQQLEIKPEKTNLDLAYRLHRLLERALIQQDIDLYKHYFEGKIGYIDKIHFSDQTGAKVNARAGAQQEIQVADIYFDTRDTIEQLKMLDKLWVTWFYKPSEDINVDRIETRIEVSKEFYIIHFTRKYTNKEVVELVLSNFKYFENLSSK